MELTARNRDADVLVSSPGSRATGRPDDLSIPPWSVTFDVAGAGVLVFSLVRDGHAPMTLGLAASEARALAGVIRRKADEAERLEAILFS